MAESPEILIFTDGACKGNPGPGGWAAILRHATTGREKRLSGSEPHTTNNRMELTGALQALLAIQQSKRHRVHLVSDSQYLLFGLRDWMDGWAVRKWHRGKSEASPLVKNADLWQELYRLVQQFEMTYENVLGHSGHPENEECDQMAVEEIDKFLRSSR